MERTIAALQICADKLRRRNVHLAHSVATEACRRASNGAQFIERVRRETGIALNIISAEEEARLAVLGCHILLEPGEGPAMIFDIGGGSTELVLLEKGEGIPRILDRSEEHTSELQSLMRTSYAFFFLKKKKKRN